MLSGELVSRRLLDRLREGLSASPVVALTGPRTAGKSTVVRDLVAATGGTYLDLDDPAVRRLAADDPRAFVQDLREPVALDEFQRVPELLSAIKSELNRDRHLGRYLLAGSARHDVVPELADFLTGRVDLLTLWPFAVAETAPGAPSVIDRLYDGSLLRARRTTATTRSELVGVVLRGGYPIAASLPVAARDRWFANLASLVVERLGDDVAPVRHRELAAQFLRLAAARTAQVATAAEVGREIGMGRDQAGVYLRLLELAYLTVRLPAWSTNLGGRIAKRPKLHMVDSGLAAHLQGTNAARVSPVDPAGASRFGALLETFVVTEVLKQRGWSELAVEPYHFRTADGVQVDLVLESADGRVAAIEIKAGSQVNARATRGLEYLRDRLGPRFVAGLVLTSGTETQRIGDRLAVAPVDVLWTS